MRGGNLPIPSLQCLLVGKSGLLASGSIETLRQRTVADQTSMLLILGFAETSNDSESIFAQGQGRFPEGRGRGGARVRHWIFAVD